MKDGLPTKKFHIQRLILSLLDKFLFNCLSYFIFPHNQQILCICHTNSA